MRDIITSKLAEMIEIDKGDFSPDINNPDICADDKNFFSCFNVDGNTISSSTRSNEQVCLFFSKTPQIQTNFKIEAHQFPSKNFQELFIKYNTPIPSSASVERIFSTAKDIFKAKRASLTDENFEKLLMLKFNN